MHVQWWVVLVLAPAVLCLDKSDFYTYGEDVDEKLQPDIEDGSSSEIQLTVPVKFYSQEYNSIFVNTNGLLSFVTEIPSFINIQFPLDYPIIAPFYSDVDVSRRGAIYYRETDARNLLDRAAGSVQAYFSSSPDFYPDKLFIATWDDVGYYSGKHDKGNSFQVVIASSESDSFVFLLYGDGALQWVQSDGKSSPNLPDARAQAGIMAGDGRYHTLRGSGSEQVRHLNRLSNSGIPGEWVFYVGRMDETSNIDGPDTVPGDERVDLATSCALGAVLCHTQATCRDYAEGYCCECEEGFYGNGRNCLPTGIPQRMNGKLTGVLNGERLIDVDLHAYVVTSDGRAYTALSRINDPLGYDMQTLLTIGNTVGWLFAVSTGPVPNGFQLTGGLLNHTTELTFPQSGQVAKVTQHYLGLDVFNYLRVNIEVQGSVPNIPSGTKIVVDDFDEELTKISNGRLRSHSSRSYHLEDSEIRTPFTVDQVLAYHQCNGGLEINTIRVKTARNFITYDAKEQIVRYASTSKVSGLVADDPCLPGRHNCGGNSACVVDGDEYQCICNPGYEQLHTDDGPQQPNITCVDINECATGRDNCHSVAECINTQGSFACRCQVGYIGDGIHCDRPRSCDNIRCDANAECLTVGVSRLPQCRCNEGWVGDGYTCTEVALPRAEDCSEADNCDANADCVYNSFLQQSRCECIPGFIGDGHTCLDENETCDVVDNCHNDAICQFNPQLDASVCICNQGYEGDGYTCEATVTNSCYDLNTCHPNAQCVYDRTLEDYTCQCNAGFDGDGYTCTAREVTCDQVNICSLHAKCVYSQQQQRYVCQCNDGYQGDGTNCNAVDECNTVEDCDPNAQCLYDSYDSRYKCQCITGYQGDGKTCVVRKDVSCDVVDNCHENAQCGYDNVGLRYRCQCISGYQGDGYNCTEVQPPCNVVNTCHLNAVCQYDPDEQGFRCFCKQNFFGDGQKCSPVRSCAGTPQSCDVNAHCVFSNVLETQICQCRHGFNGDGYSCTEIPRHNGNVMLLAQGVAILKLALTPSKTTDGAPIIIEPTQTAVGIDIDCINSYVYWSDISTSAIKRARFNGTDVQIIISRGLESPEGIAVDWAGNALFWTDSGSDVIAVSRLDGSHQRMLFNTSIEDPRDIVVHSSRGKIYWSDWSRQSPRIEGANMDGTGRKVVVADNLVIPNGLAIDHERGDLCWGDAGSHKIECFGLDGFIRRTAVAPVKYPFGLAITRTKFYWTDWESNGIQNADKVGGNILTPIIAPLGGSGKLFGIVPVPEVCPKLSSPCSLQNGGCPYLCLPNGRGGRSCLCPDDLPDDQYCNDL